MVYFDTSFLAPRILKEATSRAVERFVAGLPTGSLVVCHWTLVKFASLLARDVRMDGLTREAAGVAGRQFDAVVAGLFDVLSPAAADFPLARRFVENQATSLRAGDALHLAVASNNGFETIYSVDRTFLKAERCWA